MLEYFQLITMRRTKGVILLINFEVQKFGFCVKSKHKVWSNILSDLVICFEFMSKYCVENFFHFSIKSICLNYLILF